MVRYQNGEVGAHDYITPGFPIASGPWRGCRKVAPFHHSWAVEVQTRSQVCINGFQVGSLADLDQHLSCKLPGHDGYIRTGVGRTP